MFFRHRDTEFEKAHLQLEELFPLLYEREEFRKKNFFMGPRYSMSTLQNLIAVHENYYRSNSGMFRSTLYQLANCYQVLAARILLKNSVVLEKEQKDKAIEFLLKAKEYMQRYKYSLEYDYDDERNWIGLIVYFI